MHKIIKKALKKNKNMYKFINNKLAKESVKDYQKTINYENFVKIFDPYLLIIGKNDIKTNVRSNVQIAAIAMISSGIFAGISYISEEQFTRSEFEKCSPSVCSYVKAMDNQFQLMIIVRIIKFNAGEL